MCNWCKRRRIRKPLPEPEPPDLSSVLAIVAGIAAITLAVLPPGLRFYGAVFFPGLAFVALNDLLKPLSPLIESVGIVGTTEKDSVTYYIVAVAAGRPLQHYSVDRRYSAFDELREDLNLVCDGSFPKKSNSWFKKLSDPEEKARRQGLEAWLARTVEQVKQLNSKDDLAALASFLEVPVDKPRTLWGALREILPGFAGIASMSAVPLHTARTANSLRSDASAASQAVMATLPAAGFELPAPSAPPLPEAG
eukprot:TRINITY_DN110578_c0_g1_i1.p1 TRINITY_DN110578_c0_g1~~TRINITY_DN110578_c0_g1_i1.p1  ORF type:complete len:251 (-),score=28.88 TRINITY_DN110578_c0_g1_i1:256-1008(-)